MYDVLALQELSSGTGFEDPIEATNTSTESTICSATSYVSCG